MRKPRRWSLKYMIMAKSTNQREQGLGDVRANDILEDAQVEVEEEKEDEKRRHRRGTRWSREGVYVAGIING